MYRRRFKIILACALALAANILCGAKGGAYLSRSRYPSGQRPHETPIRLVLGTSKKTYRVGEPIKVSGYLENLSDDTYYVGNVLVSFLGGTSLHSISLEVFDQRGRKIPIGRGGGDWIWKPGTTIEQKLAMAYTQLRPHTFFGNKETIPLKLSPGSYRLNATYRETEALSWAEDKQKSLTVPVWTRPLISNTVTIRVRP
jgi:hypothetical protein